ncbi:MAG: UvrD-helicase domain-containing protein [Terracidiphilus sp.]|nr:UvrD-helicase domain-containing protein [Terracidiphilus sp.]
MKTMEKLPMNKSTLHLVPPDQSQRIAALDVTHSVLVQAPAGSGKTSLLTQRFLALLGEVDDPSQIVAITFTRAAAAEMRARILKEIEGAVHSEAPEDEDPLSTAALARRALARSHERGWNLLDQPTQLRISTIDSFCRDLALQQPLVSGLGGSLEISGQPQVLYRRAARQTLMELDRAPARLREAVETLLLWRDNNWAEMEQQPAGMLEVRDRWMRDFVLDRDPDLDALRERLERPFVHATAAAAQRLSTLLRLAPNTEEEILHLARFACEQTGGEQHSNLAQAAELPAAPFNSTLAIADAQSVYEELANFLLTKEGGFRRAINKNLGFPADRKREKQQMTELLASLATVPGLAETLDAVRALPPVRYTDDEWRIVRAAFTLLSYAAAQLRVVFAEEGACDFTEIAQMALTVLKGEQGLPGESTLSFVEGIRHLLIDEFQDTSRRQHELIANIVAAWPDMEARTCFVVGDPMQSIYFFRDAEAELFARVRDIGLELPGAEPLGFHSLQLRSNFRTAPALVNRLNAAFGAIFSEDDGSGIRFEQASPARSESADAIQFGPKAELHLAFVPTLPRFSSAEDGEKKKLERAREEAAASQLGELVQLIALHQERIARLLEEQADAAERKKYRVAVLGRTRRALAPIAEALRKAQIPFRAVELENLQERPEIVDALALARAWMNPQDRVAWLGVLRAPWCGLSLADLHMLASADDPQLMVRPVPALLAERIGLLSNEGQQAAQRVLNAFDAAAARSAHFPESTAGTTLAQLWSSLGGPLCVDATGRANLELLWQTLDALKEGEQDLLGPALDAALSKLTAQPNPTIDEQCGVQLMTIHKSKGLEFEVVIVPELQAGSGRQEIEMLSWLERGVDDPDAVEEPTEFLIAPLQAKGDERGTAKGWVDGLRREREQQEMRRLLYVAATRAREELHLFARPAFNADREGTLTLTPPSRSLLKTAWPGFGAEIEERFAAWQASQHPDMEEDTAEEDLILSLAASGSTLPARSPMLRLPAEAFDALPALQRLPEPTGAVETSALYERHEGGLRSRALGTAVHSFFEELARLREHLEWDETRAALTHTAPRIAATIRSTGLSRTQAESLANEALQIALDASATREGDWILSPHPGAASEERWTGLLAGAMRTVQVDRLFRAGAEPFSEGEDTWWIVDYKTAHPDDLAPETALAKLRPRFAAQLAAYAQVLRNLKGKDVEIRAALYYPQLKALDWWIA